MARTKRTEGEESLPGIDWVLGAEDEEEEEEAAEALEAPEEDLSRDLPRPGEAPRPEAIPGQTEAEAGPKRTRQRKAKVKKRKKEGKLTRAGRAIKERLGLVVPTDPVERMRFKLRWLGIVKFPISFVVLVVTTILILLFLWYHFLDYDASVPFYSRELPVLTFLIPAGIGLFSAFYFGMNLAVIDRIEGRMSAALEAMLNGGTPTDGKEGSPTPGSSKKAPEATAPGPDA